MNATDLVADLGRLGVVLEADGDRLRFHPRTAMAPGLLARLREHKAELLAMLADQNTTKIDTIKRGANEPDPFAGWLLRPDGNGRPGWEPPGLPEASRWWSRMPWDGLAPPPPEAKPKTWRCRCGSLAWRDVAIHDGASTRRDCARCGRFSAFTRWYGRLLDPSGNNW